MAGGIGNCCTAKCIFESTNKELSGLFGSVTNILVGLGGQITLLLGLMLPADQADYPDDEMWRVGFAFPFLVSVTQLILMFTVYKYEPVDYLILKGDNENTIVFLKTLYTATAESDFSSFVTLRR